MYNPNHAVSIDAIRDGDTYTMAVPYVTGMVLQVDGNVLPQPSPREHVLVTVTGAVPTVEVYSPVQVTTGYLPLMDGVPSLTPVAWQDMHDNLLSASLLHGGERAWARAEDEVAWMRFLRSYRAETRTVLSHVGTALVSVSDKVPEEPFVEPCRRLGGDYTSVVVSYDRPGFMADRIRQALGAMGMVEKRDAISGMPRGTFKLYSPKGELSLHLPGGFYRNLNTHLVQDSYPMVVAMRDRDSALVDGWIGEWRDNHDRPINALEVMEALDQVTSCLSRLEIKASARMERTSLLQKLNALRGKVACQTE